MTHKDRTWNLRLDNFPVFSDFLGLRAEVTLVNETPEFGKVTSWAESETFKLCGRELYEFFLNSVLREFLQLSAEKHIL